MRDWHRCGQQQLGLVRQAQVRSKRVTKMPQFLRGLDYCLLQRALQQDKLPEESRVRVCLAPLDLHERQCLLYRNLWLC
jgi:hypothetical protein